MSLSRSLPANLGAVFASERGGMSHNNPVRTEEPGETVPPETPDANERLFLSGPRSRFKEFLSILEIMGEFIRGFRTLHFVGPCVTVFGSARFKEDHPYYKLGEKV